MDSEDDWLRKTGDANGKRGLVRSKKWHGRYRDEFGVDQRVPLSANKSVAQQMLAKLADDVERKKAGTYRSADEHVRRALTEHLAAYVSEKKARGVSAENVRTINARVKAVLDGCRFVFPIDIQADTVLTFLAGLRRERPTAELPPDREWFTPAELAKLLGIRRNTLTKFIRCHGLRATAQGKSRARRYPRATAEAIVDHASRGLGSQTVSYYWREMNAFCRWMASARQQRMLINPLADIPGPAPRTDPRRDRRALALEELHRLLDATRASSWTWRGLTGEDRYTIYLTACATGYRRGELSALKPSSFSLDTDPPTASLPGRKTKNKHAAQQPLPADAAEVLRAYIEGRPRDLPIWPRLIRIAEALQHDLADAGIPYAIDGPEGLLYADFHALRHSYVKLLDDAGLSVKQAMSLARHGDPRLTLARYGKLQIGDLGSAVDRLPSLTTRPDSKPEAAVIRATGIAGNVRPRASEMCPDLTPSADSGCNPVRTGDNFAPSRGVSASAERTGQLRVFDGSCESVIADNGDGGKERDPGERRQGPLNSGKSWCQ